MVSNSEVIRAWTHGRPAKAQNLRTDGNWLWSYNLVIAMGKEVLQFTANGNRGFFSMTTSHHVGMANRQIANKK